MRGGTTIIHRALCTARNSNPYISESWFLHDVMSMFSWGLRRYDVRHADQIGDVQNFVNLIKSNFEQYFDLVSQKYQHPEVLILKHPELTPHFLDIHDMFPSMCFLVIVRDPRDVISSMKRVREKHIKSKIMSPLTKMKTIGDLCAHYANYYQMPLRDHAKFSQKIRFVRYEDVMREPEKSIAMIGDFCGASYEEVDVAGFNATDARNFDKDLRLQDPLSGAFWSDLYTESLSGEKIGKFSQTLSNDEIEEVQRRLNGIGQTFKYWS